jgi:hypothetical protein
VKVPRGDIVGNLGLRNKRRSDVACLSKTVLTVTAVDELYRAEGLDAIPHLWDAATLFCKKTAFAAPN